MQLSRSTSFELTEIHINVFIRTHGMGKCNKSSEVLCDGNIHVMLNGKIIQNSGKSMPTLLYGTETWAIMKSQERKMELNEMKVLRWTCGVTKKDKIRNELVRGSVKVAIVVHTLQEKGRRASTW